MTTLLKVMPYFLLLGSLSAFAQIELKEGDVSTQSRYDYISTGSNRLQQRVTLGFTIDANGWVELVGFVANAQKYRDGFETWTTFNDKPNDNPQLAFRQLYLRKVMGNLKVEAGAMNPEANVGAGGIYGDGWMDGIRVQYHAQFADIKIIGGSLKNFEQPSAFKRSFEGNFFEVEISKKMFDDLTADIAYERLDGEDNIRSDVKYDLHVLSDKVITLVGSYLYDFQKQGYDADVGLQLDALDLALNRYKGRLNMKIYYSYLDASMENRNMMVSQFFTTGPRLTLQLDGKIDKDGKFSWFTRVSQGISPDNKDKFRFDAGFKMKLGYKKVKPLPVVEP